MAAGGRGRARAEVVSVELPDSMPEIAAALGLIARAAAGAAAPAAGPPVAAAPAATVPEALASFAPGDDVDVPTEERLRADCPAYGDAISALSSAIGALGACSAEVRRLREMQARAQDVGFGRTSERSSSLGLGGAEDGGEDGRDGEPTCGGGGDECGDDDRAEDDRDDADGEAEAGDAGNGKKKGRWPHERRKGGRPRRSKGCQDHVARDAVRVKVQVGVDELELEGLRARGLTLKRMSPTTYEVLHRYDVTFLVEVESERFLVVETGAYVHADTAAASKPMANSPLGADVLAGVLHERYALGITAPKVEQRARAAGLGITRQTIYRACTQLAVAVALPLVRHLLWHVVRCECAQSDETWLRVRQELAEEGRQNSVMWLVRTGERLGVPPAVVLAHTGTRSADALAGLLAGFAGKLTCDGYSGYPAALELLAKALREARPDAGEVARAAELCGCLQHVRAKFADAVQALHRSPEWRAMSPADREALPAARAIAQLSAVFAADAGMPDGTRDERAGYRRAKVRPLLDEALATVDLYLATPLGEMDDYLGKALRYADAQRERLYAAVDDPDVALSNTACEREFAFFGTIRSASRQLDSSMGAWALAMWFSLVRTALLNGADARAYLQYVLEEGPRLLREHGDWSWPAVPKDGWRSYDPGPLRTEEEAPYLEALMPWSDAYRKYEAGFRGRRRDEFVLYAGLIGESAPEAADPPDDDAADPPEAADGGGPEPTPMPTSPETET